MLRRGTLGTGWSVPRRFWIIWRPWRDEQHTPEQEQALEETMRQFPPAAELAIAEEFCTPEPQETGVRRQPHPGIPVAGVPAEGSRAGVTAFPVLLTLVGKASGQYTDQSNVVLMCRELPEGVQ